MRTTRRGIVTACDDCYESIRREEEEKRHQELWVLIVFLVLAGLTCVGVASQTGVMILPAIALFGVAFALYQMVNRPGVTSPRPPRADSHRENQKEPSRQKSWEEKQLERKKKLEKSWEKLKEQQRQKRERERARRSQQSEGE